MGIGGLTPYQHLWSNHGENKVLVYSVIDDRIYEVILGKRATVITSLLFSNDGKFFFMCNVL